MELIDKAIKEIESEFAEVLTSHGYDSYEKADIFYQWYCDGLMKAIGILLDMEAEQPTVERKTGRWEMKPDPYGFFDEIPVCSECGCTTKWREKYLYCPNCGARMEGGKQ